MDKENHEKIKALSLGDKLSEEDKILLYESLKLHSETVNRIFKLVIVITVCFCVTLSIIVGTFLIYLYQYDYSGEVTTTTTTVEQDTSDGGDANYVGRDGSINYGETGSNNDNNSSKENKN